MVVAGELPIGLIYSVNYQGDGKPHQVTIVWEVTAHQQLNGRIFSILRFVSVSAATPSVTVGPTEFKEQ